MGRSDSAPTPPLTPASSARRAYRVAKELSELSDKFTVATSESTGAEAPILPHGDFIVQHLDLRIRIMLVNEDLSLRESRTRAIAESLQLLQAWPETSAVIAVSGDDALSSLLVEPYDSPVAVTAPSGEPLGQSQSLEPEPMGDLLRSYLDANVVDWTDIPPESRKAQGLDLEEEVSRVARRARKRANSQRAIIAEKKQALSGISDHDEKWIGEVLLRLMSGARADEAFLNDVRAYLEDEDD